MLQIWLELLLIKYNPVGFDIELIHPKVLKIYHKFLNTNEQNVFDIKNERELIAAWSMKECLYKIAGEKKLDFKTQLLLSKNNKQYLSGQIILKTKIIHVNLHYFEFKNYIISINVNSPLDVFNT
jgi:4'-phosphopantetheinyl transferase